MNPNVSSPVIQLPADFDGTFRFTNWTDRDFQAKWGGVTYTFPALKTTPMIIPTLTPLEIQVVRKKFAKELAEREFFQSKKSKDLDKKNENATFFGSVSYTDNDLTDGIQKCLSPLPVGQLKAEETPNPHKNMKPRAAKVVKSRMSGDTEDDVLVTDKGNPLV